METHLSLYLIWHQNKFLKQAELKALSELQVKIHLKFAKLLIKQLSRYTTEFFEVKGSAMFGVV